MKLIISMSNIKNKLTNSLISALTDEQSSILLTHCVTYEINLYFYSLFTDNKQSITDIRLN